MTSTTAKKEKRLSDHDNDDDKNNNTGDVVHNKKRQKIMESNGSGQEEQVRQCKENNNNPFHSWKEFSETETTASSLTSSSAPSSSLSNTRTPFGTRTMMTSLASPKVSILHNKPDDDTSSTKNVSCKVKMTSNHDAQHYPVVPEEQQPPPPPPPRVHFSPIVTERLYHQQQLQEGRQVTRMISIHDRIYDRAGSIVWKLQHSKLLVLFIFIISYLSVAAFFQSSILRTKDHHPQFQTEITGQHEDDSWMIIPPKTNSKQSTNNDNNNLRADVTLREFLMDPSGIYLGMAPAFFGFYGYFGALAAWEDILSNSTFNILHERINGVAGASAGAMAAILLAAGVAPQTAAEFCGTITLSKFADFPGLLTIFKGDLFEQIMYDFLRNQTKPHFSLLLQDAPIPVAVSGFDLQTFSGKLLNRGSMARAARASACFPFLFQPVGWVDGNNSYMFIDGGISDTSGVAGLAALKKTNDHHHHHAASKKKRVVNLVVGDFLGRPPGPSDMPDGVDASDVLSISIQNLPRCGPWAMENGPLAVEAARRAMRTALDSPVYFGKEDGHYELHIDAAPFLPIK